MKPLQKTLAIIAATAVLVSIPVSAQAGEIQRSGTYAWGANQFGSLGTGSLSDTVNSPTLSKSVSNFPITQVSTSETHTLYLDDKGNVYASGNNAYGELGDGTTDNSAIPVKVKLPLRYGVPDYATQVWAGNGVSFIEGGFGNLYAWGNNENGMTGLGLTDGATYAPTLTSLTLADTSRDSLSVGATHVTAIHNDPDNGDQLYAWGDNSWGELGNPNLGQVSATPKRVLIPNPDEETTKTVTTCTTDENGFQNCEDQTVQKSYDELVGLAPKYLANGNGFSVAVTSSDVIYTWGRNNDNQLGTYTSNQFTQPYPATSPTLQIENGATVDSISAGDSHVILLASNGLLYGWGSNRNSQTAPYYQDAENAPVTLKVLQRLTILQENNSLAPWDYVIASGNSSYAVTNDGDIYGWGDNSQHQLANLNTTVTVPTKIAFPYDTTVNSFTAGGGNVLALTNYTETYPDLELPTATFANGTYNTAYNKTLTAKGGYPGNPLKWTISGLPAGLTYNASTGAITGKPTTAGTYTINYAVTDNVDTLSDSSTLVVAKATPTVAVTYSSTLPGKVTAKATVLSGTTAGTGSVRFYVGTKYTTVALNKGAATTTLSYTAGSTQALKVAYTGSSVLNSVTSASKNVKALAKWNVTPAPSYSVKARTVTVKVPAIKSGTTLATGNIYLYDGSKKVVAGTLKNGAVTFSKSFAKGNHKFTVRYSGNGYFNAKNSAVKSITLK